MDNIITIELFGQQYTFKADADVANADEVAGVLKKEVAALETQLSGRTTVMGKTAIVALAALNITKDYVELQKKHAELLQYFAQKSASLITQINVNPQ